MRRFTSLPTFSTVGVLGTLRRPALLVAVAALAVGASGCVGPKQHRAVKADRDRLQTELAAARDEAASNRGQADTYRQQMTQYVQSNTDKDTKIGDLSAENRMLQDKLAKQTKTYDAAVATTTATGGTLPSALRGELTELARANPDLLEFDARVGMVKVKSDLAFASGSADLTPKGKAAVEKLAKLLSTGEASGYELMVAGHTDDMKVSKPSTIKSGHKDNWYLSSHRAISVGQALQGKGVSAKRMSVVGYAEQRPAFPNATADGRAKNRRVEVLVLPTKVSPEPTKPAVAKVTFDKKAAPKPTAGNKDGGTTDASFKTVYFDNK